jgi:hypothetical protein
MIPKEIIYKWRRKAPILIQTTGSLPDGSHPVPLDYENFNSDLNIIDGNMIVCDEMLGFQVLEIMKAYASFSTSDKRLVIIDEDMDDITVIGAYILWPKYRFICIVLGESLKWEYYIVNAHERDDEYYDLTVDIIGKPLHRTGITSDY